MPQLIPVTTARLGEHLPLLDLLPDSAPVTWVRGGDGLVGWGSYATTKVSGPNRFNDARKWWHQQLEKLAISDSVHVSGTGPILFSSFAFSETEDSILIIPNVVIGEKKGKSWISWIGNKPQPKLSQISTDKKPLELRWSGSNSVEWQARVSQAIAEIKDNSLEKVVLARFIDCQVTPQISAQRILRNLAAEYPATWIFSNNGLVGATPELLVRLSKSLVTSRILAGTIRKTGNDEKDLALAGSLARSSKDLEEHEYAVRSVADVLAPICTSTNVPEIPFVLHLANVMHLATDVTGVLTDSASPTDIFELAHKLHPSAAVCGTPTPLAKKTINDIEGISRGRYAGPIGWIDARGDGELGIALRCGQISNDAKSIRLFAGCGIVNGSNPESEYAESQAKLLPIRSALERH